MGVVFTAVGPVLLAITTQTEEEVMTLRRVHELRLRAAASTYTAFLLARQVQGTVLHASMLRITENWRAISDLWQNQFLTP